MAGAAVVLFALCLLFPYSGDDWTWGGQTGLDRLSSGFANYNGRYAGNLLIICLSRFYILRSAAVCLCMVGIAWAVYRIAGKDRRGFWLALLLLAFMPAAVRRQSIVWASGFANYAVSTFLLLLYLIHLKDAFDGKTAPVKKPVALAFFLLGFAGSLFMENITLSNLAVALIALLYTRFKFGRWDICQVLFLAGCILGAVVMFSNGNYMAILAHKETYRSLGSSGSDVSVADKYLKTLAPGAASNNYAIAICMFAGSLGATVGAARKNGRLHVPGLCSALAFALFSLYFVYSSFFSAGNASDFHLEVVGIVAALFLAMLLAVACFLWKRARRMPLFVWGLVVSQLMPLFVVNPTGPRNFFPIYVLLMVFAILYLHDTVEFNGKMPAPLMPALALAAFVPWFVWYAPVAETAMQRSAIVEEALQSGYQEIVLPKMPADLVHDANPQEATFKNTKFKERYGIPSDVKVRFE